MIWHFPDFSEASNLFHLSFLRGREIAGLRWSLSFLCPASPPAGPLHALPSFLLLTLHYHLFGIHKQSPILKVHSSSTSTSGVREIVTYGIHLEERRQARHGSSQRRQAASRLGQQGRFGSRSRRGWVHIRTACTSGITDCSIPTLPTTPDGGLSELSSCYSTSEMQ